MFAKILIANRGEIAVRIIKTCRKMGIKTVAVYSEADTNALHVKEADEAVYIGPSPSVESYLDIENILNAIDQTGAEAVHPGYGFLSENPDFAKKLKQLGVTLIGPSFDAVSKMGDKIESKKIAIKAGVNTVPGTLDVVSSDEEAIKAAAEIGYPVMIKAAAGGGGKGMRVARSEKDLLEGIRSASSEAGSSFGDERVFIERFFDNPRHIEIQLLGDIKGNVVSLGERECSIQRRHQKIIEEAPSTFLSDALREKMSKQAVALAHEVKYFSAGTVEFIVDQDGEFYFLEMNTRLQVEHRVTELITGIDLVEWMIRIAAGEALDFKQEDVKFNGWSIEARIYAEDPKRGFLPSSGRITRYAEPENMHNMLIDSGVYEGGEVSMFYDPMIAKVCSHSPTREEAMDTLQQTLSAFVVRGIEHNMSFLEAILTHPRFREGDISTNFIEQEYPDGFTGADMTSESTRVFLGTAITIFLRDTERAAKISNQLPGRMRAIGSRWVVNVDEQNYAVFVRGRENGYDIIYERDLISVRTSWKLGRRLFQAAINGKQVSVKVKHANEGYVLTYGGSDLTVKVRTPRIAELAEHMPEPKLQDSRDRLLAPIAGMIADVRVKVGEKIKIGHDLLVLEAMKMENVIVADHEAIVKSVNVAAGDSVQVDQVLLEFTQEEEPEAKKK